MSSRIYFLILFVIPVFAARGGVGHRGGYGGHHSYPASHGLSGTHNSPGTYANTGHSSSGHPHQDHNYPYSSTGLSGKTPPHTYGNQRTEVHHHYHYSPPQHISYGSTHHPVYVGVPPTYVYEYRDSGSRFSTLLTGLALYNLGRMSAQSNHHSYDSRHREYDGSPGEKCKFAIKKDNGDYEETRIDCKLMSSFIWEQERSRNSVEPSKTVTVTKSESTVKTNNDSSVTTVVEKETVVVEDALKVKGPSVAVTPGMKCYMIRVSWDSSVMRKQVDCGLLQTYAMSSFRSHSSRNLSVITSLIILSGVLHLVQ